MTEPLAFFDIDTQVDFMLPHGKLYVPRAEEIIPSLRRLMTCARRRGIPVISTADAHAPDDPEFATWPPHCVIGTPGQWKIPETQWPDPLRIPAVAGACPGLGDWSRQVVIEKAAYDPSANPHFDAVVGALGSRRAVIFGVATEFCVRATVLALRRRHVAVDLVEDALQGITPAGAKAAMEEMAAAGARRVSTGEVLAWCEAGQ